jgi:ATP-dependent DNA helicase PIF1
MIIATEQLSPVERFLQQEQLEKARIATAAARAASRSGQMQFERYEDVRKMNNGILIGGAGTGKTTLIKECMESASDWGIVCATTGTASMNLGAKLGYPVSTINALLWCAHLQAFRRAYQSGALVKCLRGIRQRRKRLVVDEASMMLREIFDIVYLACKEVGLGLILVADFAQLAPVVTPRDAPTTPLPYWAFESKHWQQFIAGGKNLIRLTQNHRQKDGNSHFYEMLNSARRGDGMAVTTMYADSGCKRRWDIDENFPGITLTGTIDLRDRVNNLKYSMLSGRERTYEKTFYGMQWLEWQDIPSYTKLKVGTQVMVTRNLSEHGLLTQANGTMGTVELMAEDIVHVMTDNGLIVVGMHSVDDGVWVPELDYFGNPILDSKGRHKGEYTKPTAGVTYMPLTPAWALTTHKAQGLTITKPIQIAVGDFLFKYSHGLLYVALSRAQRADQITLAGHHNKNFSDRCYSDPKVLRFDKE